MPSLLGTSDNSVKIKISTDANTQGVDDTTRSLGRLESSSSLGGKAVSALGVVAKATALGVAAMGAATAVAGRSAIAGAADFEQTRIGLENMLGSADAARKMLKNISQFAADTPFEFPELADATRQLVAFGFSGDEAFTTMKQLGDVSAAIGAPIGDLSYLMGTLRAQGRAFTVDIRQFAQRGIPIYEYLAKVLKTDTKALSGMIEEGKVGFPEVQKAFEMMTASGGKFHGTMEKQSKSLSGLFSTLKDNIGLAGRELVGISQEGDVKAGSLFDRLRISATLVNEKLSTIDWSSVSEKVMVMAQSSAASLATFGRSAVDVGIKIADYLMPKLGELWNVIKGRFIPAVADFVRVFGPAAGAGLVWAIGAAIDAATLFLQVITPVINYLSEHTPVVWGMVAAFAAIRAVLFINAATTTFIGAMTAVQATLATTTAVAGTTSGALGTVRGLLILLSTPWVVTLTVVGVGTVIASLMSLKDMLDKIAKGFDDLKAKSVSVNGKNVSGTSDVGLVAQLRNAFGGFRAAGGPVSLGKSYVVGENGPEVFTPSSSGEIMSNRDSRALANNTQNSSVNNNRSVTIGTVINQTAGAATEFFNQLDSDTLLAGRGMATNRGAA